MHRVGYDAGVPDNALQWFVVLVVGAVIILFSVAFFACCVWAVARGCYLMALACWRDLRGVRNRRGFDVLPPR